MGRDPADAEVDIPDTGSGLDGGGMLISAIKLLSRTTTNCHQGAMSPAGHLTPRPAPATPQTHSQQNPHLLHLSTGGIRQQRQLQRLFWKR